MYYDVIRVQKEATAMETDRILAQDRLILALDISNEAEADKLINELEGHINIFKVNFRLVFAGVNLFSFI